MLTAVEAVAARLARGDLVARLFAVMHKYPIVLAKELQSVVVLVLLTRNA